jgi:hypothetical protein
MFWTNRSALSGWLSHAFSSPSFLPFFTFVQIFVQDTTLTAFRPRIERDSETAEIKRERSRLPKWLIASTCRNTTWPPINASAPHTGPLTPNHHGRPFLANEFHEFILVPGLQERSRGPLSQTRAGTVHFFFLSPVLSNPHTPGCRREPGNHRLYSCMSPPPSIHQPYPSLLIS